MPLVFSAKRLGLIVWRYDDGSLACTGRYNGIDVVDAVPIDDGARCVLLLDPDGGHRLVFENLLCVDPDGAVVWAAKLPSMPDKFVAMRLTDDGICANTWSCYLILLDPDTGAELSITFTK